MIQICGMASKKPVKINWFRWRGFSKTKLNELKTWIESLGENPDDVLEINDNNLKIKTLEGSSYNVPEDYIIIRGIKGEYYPCERNIFNQTYDII